MSIIAKCLRKLGWGKQIIIKNHGVSQEYINKIAGKNKFLYLCKILNIELNNIKIKEVKFPDIYWKYEKKQKKLHLYYYI